MAAAGENAKTKPESLTSFFMHMAFIFSNLQLATFAKTGWQ
jgi:hypothetical protein